MSERSTRSSTRSFSRTSTRGQTPTATSPLAGIRRSYFRSSLATNSADLETTPEDRQEDEEEDEQLASACTLSGELDFPDVVCKLDGEVNESERRVQLGLAKFMVVSEDAPARDVLSAMELTWGLDRPGALFSLAGGVTNLKLHTVLAQVHSPKPPAPISPAAPPLHLLCVSSAPRLCRFLRRASPRRRTSRAHGWSRVDWMPA